MKNLPEIISTKDTSYLKDMFNWNIINAQKFDHYVDFVEDKKIIKKLNDLVTMHFEFCKTIIELLESGENNDW